MPEATGLDSGLVLAAIAPRLGYRFDDCPAVGIEASVTLLHRLGIQQLAELGVILRIFRDRAALLAERSVGWARHRDSGRDYGKRVYFGCACYQGPLPLRGRHQLILSAPGALFARGQTSVPATAGTCWQPRLRAPGDLVIGVDASAASMAQASWRAARPVRRGGLANAVFVVAAAEALPPELADVADTLTIHFPWGSLLRGLLTANAAILDSIARVTRPGASVRLLLSVTDRDNLANVERVDDRTFADLAATYAAHGLALLDARPATHDEIVRSHSTWAKRLRAGTSRQTWRVSLGRCDRELHEGMLDAV